MSGSNNEMMFDNNMIEQIDKSIDQSEKEIAEGAMLMDIEEAFSVLDAKFF